MVVKPLLIFVILSVIGFASTLPLAPPQTQQELIQDISKFLRENEDVAQALRNVDMDHLMIRSRRDAVDDSMMEVDISRNPQQEAGFFDRAAKFMMEVLQRFLKWINTDN